MGRLLRAVLKVYRGDQIVRPPNHRYVLAGRPLKLCACMFVWMDLLARLFSFVGKWVRFMAGIDW